MKPSPFWAVAQSKVGRELFALDRAERAGFEVYLPRIKARDRNWQVRVGPLFPGYLFVHIVDHWQPLLRTIGISRVLLNGDQPAQLPESALAEIKAREIKGYVMLSPALKPGQKVQILSGSFQGRIAIYEGQSARDRERVLLEFLGQTVRAEVRAGDLAPLGLV